MYHTLHGDWRALFREVENIDKVTAADVKRVANATFIDKNRTVGKIESIATPAAAPAAPAAKGGASK
jgi:predicted Zn-dependent peptidase